MSSARILRWQLAHPRRMFNESDPAKQTTTSGPAFVFYGMPHITVGSHAGYHHLDTIEVIEEEVPDAP